MKNHPRKNSTPTAQGTAALGHEMSRAEFLGLTPVDESVVRIRLALHRKLRESRERSGLTQSALAKRVGSSQSRIAKAEAGSASVSVDLLFRAMLASGATPGEIGDAIRDALEPVKL